MTDALHSGRRRMESSPLTGMTAIITGGSGAIGRAAALSLLQDGATVLLMARNDSALQRARDFLLERVSTGNVLTYAGDACDADAVEAAVEAAHGVADRIDIVVATVGQGAFRPLLDHDIDSFRDALERNIISSFLAIRYTAPRMRGGGSIICVSSTVAKRTARWMSAYGTGKSGLEGLVQAAAEELADHNIRVNAIRPGPVRSHLRAELFDEPEIANRFIGRIPLGRIGTASDIAEGIRFLAGPRSAWLTGQSFAIDGGSELRGQPDITDIITFSRDGHID